MQYIWMVLIIMLEVSWLISTIHDIIVTYKAKQDKDIFSILEHLDNSSIGFFVVHIFILGMISFLYWLTTI